MRAYKANMIPGGVTPTINVSQYDNDYAVTVTLIEGAEIYTPPSGATIRVEGTKPDGHGFEYPCTYQGNVVTMPIYTQMTVVAGRFPIELVVYQNGLRVGSCNIIFAVEKAPLGEDTDISETVIPDIIAGAQAQADAAAASATSAATSATSAESAKVAAMDAAEDAIEAAQELETAVQFNSALIKETVSGDIAIFADGSDNIPVQSLVAEITPVQSGSGDPSPTNIRPISGRTGLTVTRAGKNLLNYVPDTPSGTASGLTWSTANGVLTVNGTATANQDVGIQLLTLRLPTGIEYALSGGVSGGATSRYFLGIGISNANNVHRFVYDTGNGATFTLAEDEYIYRVYINVKNGVTVSNFVFRPMIRPAAITDDTFEPYTGTEIPTTWETEAGTVYGGTLDVVSGVLTVDRGSFTYDGSVGVSKSSVTSADVFLLNNTAFGYVLDGTALVDKFQFVDSTTTQPVGKAWIGTSATQLRVAYSEYGTTTLAQFKTWLSNNPVQLVAKLATPSAVYQLTPTEVKTLLGGNTIYTDAGAVSVEYVADTKLYIDNKVAELQALILEN